MFSIGWFEIMTIAVLALLLFGADEMPKMARQLGAWMKRARHLFFALQRDWDELVGEDDDSLIGNREENKDIPTVRAYRKSKKK